MKVTSVIVAAALGAQVAYGEVVHLVNSYKGDSTSSGMAYYANGRNPPNQPNDYIDVHKPGFVLWEGQTVRGKLKHSSTFRPTRAHCLGHFNSGVTFTSRINSPTPTKAGAKAGTGDNEYKEWNCFKSVDSGATYPVLYTVDGWDVYSVYYCTPQ